MHVLVSMAGAGSRFAKEGYELPKPLIPISGEPMVVKAINDLPQGDEYTFVRFTVKKDGKVDDNLGFLKKKLVGNLPLHESFQ